MQTERYSKNHTTQELLNDHKFLFRLGNKIGELGVVSEKRSRLIVALACITASAKWGARQVVCEGVGRGRFLEVRALRFPAYVCDETGSGWH